MLAEQRTLGIAAPLVGAEGSELLLAIFMGAYAVIFVAETAYRALSGHPVPQAA
jgi:hypothetical protein